MACTEEIHVGDIGTVFEVTIKDGSSVVDISSATALQIIFKKPDDSSLTKIAIFSSDGTDGKMKYTSVANDLNISGSWRLQGRVVMPVGEWRSTTGNFGVYKNL